MKSIIIRILFLLIILTCQSCMNTGDIRIDKQRQCIISDKPISCLVIEDIFGNSITFSQNDKRKRKKVLSLICIDTSYTITADSNMLYFKLKPYSFYRIYNYNPLFMNKPLYCITDRDGAICNFK